MSRISREAMYMEMAEVAAKRSTCARLAVGCVITNGINTVIGYNGPPKREDHCNFKHCDWTNIDNTACLRSTHAEVNALSKITGVFASYPLTMFCTHSPCQECTESIIKLNQLENIVDKFYFKELYRSVGHLNLFRLTGVELYRLHPSFQVDYFTGEVKAL